ncbi:hypothetical protein [Streptomyces sp. NPDC051577]|uniref:hypothetical protein n=1 Tax=Streptomyces sp. NPDC051577 TaxID=3155166 RepID=UPI00342D1A41
MLITVIVLLPALLCGVLALGRYEELLLGSLAEDRPPQPAGTRPPEVAPAPTGPARHRAAVVAGPARHRAQGRRSRPGPHPARLNA